MKQGQPEILTVGGQAVVEGVMMRTPIATSVAVRRPDGSLAVRVKRVRRLAERFPVLAAPGLRGITVLFETIADGISSLNFAASQVLPEEEARSPHSTVSIAFTTIFSLFFGFCLFAVVPHAVTLFIGDTLEIEALSGGRSVSFHLADGIVKVALFLVFLWAISLLKDIRRVFQYHGAEHQAVHTYESGLNLFPRNLSRFPTEHPRCGTAFLVMVIVVSIVVFSVVFAFIPPLAEARWLNQVIYIALKAPMVLPIAAISYEFVRYSARARTRAVALLLAAPGILFQKITTRKPEQDQQEVAIVALLAALGVERFLREPWQNEVVLYFRDFDAFIGAQAFPQRSA